MAWVCIYHHGKQDVHLLSINFKVIKKANNSMRDQNQIKDNKARCASSNFKVIHIMAWKAKANQRLNDNIQYEKSHQAN